MTSLALHVVDLTKIFMLRERASGFGAAFRQLFRSAQREQLAVDRVSFTVERGERVAFVGPNGAGKSTTIKMLSGILHPTSGHAEVLGLTPWRDRRALAYRIGTVFGQRSQLWYHLPAADTFELLARVYDCDPATHRRRLASLVDAFELGPELRKPVRQLSLGERMRCEVVASLLHDPALLFLDEPTIGLDVTAKARIRELLREQSEREGKTLLFTSHDTGDMESVCERVIIIHHGRVLVDQSLDSLRRDHIKKKLLTLHTVESECDLSLFGTRVLSHGPHRTVLEVDLEQTPVEHVVQQVMAKARLRDLTISDPPMDDVIRQIYARANSRSAADPLPAIGPT